MYNEPHQDEEQYRLKRKEDKGNGLDSGTVMHWVFIPAVIGMLATTVLVVAVPSIITSMTRGVSLNTIAENLMRAIDKEFSLLGDMKWGETNLWLYLLFGALLGILIKYCYSDSKLR